MDIAKIRKKRKGIEADSPHSVVDNQMAEGHEATNVKPDEKNSKLKKAEAAINQEAEAIGNEKIQVEEERIKAKDRESKIEGDKTDDVIEMLTLRLLKEEFAFRISQLEEILRYQKITMVPKMPEYVLGITSLRGKIIPVIDLRLKLSLKDKPSNIDDKGKILIIKGPRGPIGAAIDKVMGTVRIAKSEILPPPSHLTETELKFIEGIAVVDKRFISILHMEEAIKM